MKRARIQKLTEARQAIMSQLGLCEGHEVVYYNDFAQYTGCKPCDKLIAEQRELTRPLQYGGYLK